MSDIPGLDLHTAALGMTGGGKTNTVKVAIEQVYAEGARVCILDPIKSDWWGITSSADGKSPGLPFHILGGPRGHVPLHSGAGAAIGELVARGKLRHSIIDMAQFEPGGQVRFFCDFMPTLLREMRGFLYLVMEEAHMFAPKEKGGVGNETMSTHWAKMAATAGRSKGIRLIVATQRTQALHNAVLGSCQTMIAHRLVTPADQKPVLEWLKAHVRENGRREEIAASLGGLRAGEGWLCASEAGIFERRQFPLASTYDNTATPTDDDTEHDVATATVDAAALRAAIGEAIQVAEANDPVALKKRIVELEQQFEDGAGASPEELAAAEERGHTTGRQEGYGHGHADGYLAALEHTLDDLKARGERWAERVGRTVSFSEGVIEAFKADTPAPSEYASSPGKYAPAGDSPTQTAPVYASKGKKHTTAPAPRAIAGKGDGTVTDKAQRAFLTVLAQHRRALARNQVAIFAGYSSKSSHVDNTISSLRTRGYVSGGRDGLEITPDGRKALGKYTPLPTGQALQEYWIRELDSAGGKFLTIICAAHPRTLTRDQIAEKAGYSTSSSHVDNTLSSLRTRGLITGPRGAITASEELFG